MAKFNKFGNEQNWLGYIREFPKLQDKNFGDWLYDAQWTYYGNVKGELPHGQGRVVYNDGDCYEGKWNNGFMEKGKYVKNRNPDGYWVFDGTFTEGDCPEKGIFSDGHNQLDVTCTEKKSIHELQFWIVLKGLLDKQVTDTEAKVNEQIIDGRWKDAQPMIDTFKKKWISGNYQECRTTITLSPVVLFLCSENDMIECKDSDVEKGSMTGRECITKESRIVATIPRVLTKIQVWLWCKDHLQARMDSDEIQDVFYNTEERKIAELDFSSAQFEGGAVVRHTLKLNKARNPFSILIHLEFKLQNADEVGDPMDLGSLLATLRTYV
jgi:hypothetical protein